MLTVNEYERSLTELETVLSAPKLDKERFHELVMACLEYEQATFPIDEALFKGTDLEWLVTGENENEAVS